MSFWDWEGGPPLWFSATIIVLVLLVMAWLQGCSPSMTPRPPECDTADGQYQQLVWTGVRFVECGEL